MRSFAKPGLLFSSLLCLAGCVTALPPHVERAGTLPDARYAQFDAAVASLPKIDSIGGQGRFPEPKWVYAFDAPFDPRAAPLQIGGFTGHGDDAARVASNLPGQLVRVIGEARLFPQVTLQPTPHAYVLSGTVTRADNQETMDNGASTQIEATVSRDGREIGAIQVNAVQIGVMPFSPFMLVASAVMSAGQGSRAAFVAERVSELFASTSDGAKARAWSGGISRRFLYTPAATD